MRPKSFKTMTQEELQKILTDSGSSIAHKFGALNWIDPSAEGGFDTLRRIILFGPNVEMQITALHRLVNSGGDGCYHHHESNGNDSLEKLLLEISRESTNPKVVEIIAESLDVLFERNTRIFSIERDYSEGGSFYEDVCL